MSIKHRPLLVFRVTTITYIFCVSPPACDTYSIIYNGVGLFVLKPLKFLYSVALKGAL